MMRVSVMNLGETPRIFHDRLGKPVAAPVGRVTIVDLTERVVDGLRNPHHPETVLVRDASETGIPSDVKGVVELLHILEFDGYDELLIKFLALVPPNNLTQIRPSRQQMRMTLRTMIEDWVEAQRSGSDRPGRFTRDDIDPRELQREADEEEKRREPVHPLRREQEKRTLRDSQYQRAAQPMYVLPETPLRAVETDEVGGDEGDEDSDEDGEPEVHDASDENDGSEQKVDVSKENASPSPARAPRASVHGKRGRR
jgi:hypothetical protein